MNSPQQPSPAQITAQQTQINNAAAAANQAYSMPNQVDYQGNTLTSVQTGTRTIPAVTKVNKKGKTVVLVPEQQIPVYTQTAQLSPAQQQLRDQQNQFGAATNALGLAQVGRLEDVLSKPVDLSNDNVSGYITDLYRKRLDPIWNDRQQSLETELRNQGLQPGSKGWDAAMANFDYGRNDAYDQVLRSARAQSVQEMLGERNQYINETGALMSGGQVSPLQFANLGGPTVGPVDYAAQNANAYNQKMAQYNAMVGGMFDLGGATVKAFGPAALPSTPKPSPGGWSTG